MAFEKILIPLFVLLSFCAATQPTGGVSRKILDHQQQPVAGATAELFLGKDSTLGKVQVSDSTGLVLFNDVTAGRYFLRITHLGYLPYYSEVFSIEEGELVNGPGILLQPADGNMATVTVSTRRAFIETKPGKTVVNMDAAITNAGSTVLEALEKLPGISVDKDGNIALKGRTGVTVLIDGKQTYLDGAQLSNLLSGMNAAQLSQVEIMNQPASEYDAAGNAGIINIKLKKNDQRGFHGSVTSSYAQGFYPKTNHNLQMNLRHGALNWFLNYGINSFRSFTRIDALRSYFNPDGTTVRSMLEQPSFLKGLGLTQNLRTGVDFTLSQKTTVGMGLSGLLLQRKGNGNNTARWRNAAGFTDSLINTDSRTDVNWKNGGINLNMRHQFSGTKELSADADLIGYRTTGVQTFTNNGLLPTVYAEASRADLPSTIRIVSAKTDYAAQHGALKFKAGAKASRIKTNNLAAYQYLDGTTWKEDLGRSNHFLYEESIHALYSNAETNLRKWNLQAGLRYEMTNYNAAQLGNAVVKDSSFSRSYNSLFPTLFASYSLDSAHTFSVSSGRRIDRPPFQSLNPFLFIINKYTYQQGNPFYRPQYTWNLDVSHQYKTWLITSLTYSVSRDYFSQVFPVNNNGIVIYTVGNLDRLQTFGASVSVQATPASWWSFNAQGNITHRKMEGFIEKEYKASIRQGTFTLNNQLRFKKGWAGEVSGFYSSRSQNDIQEIIDPAGQFSLGLSKTVWQNKGTIRLAARDIFYTQWMKGITQFRLSNEYFHLSRDTRQFNLSFSYRFGKTFKANRRSQGAAGEEIQRVGNG